MMDKEDLFANIFAYFVCSCIALGIALSIAGYVFFAEIDEETSKVDCYDRYKNKIVGEKCIHEYVSVDYKDNIVSTTGGVFLILGIAPLAFIIIINFIVGARKWD